MLVSGRPHGLPQTPLSAGPPPGASWRHTGDLTGSAAGGRSVSDRPRLWPVVRAELPAVKVRAMANSLHTWTIDFMQWVTRLNMGAFDESMLVTVVWRGRRYVSSDSAQAGPVLSGLYVYASVAPSYSNSLAPADSGNACGSMVQIVTVSARHGVRVAVQHVRVHRTL